MNRISVAAITLALLVPLCGQARTYKDDKAKVSVDIPDNWKVEAEEDLLSASAPDDSIGLVFLVMPAEAVDKALEELDKELSKMMTDMKPKGEAEEIKLNGMEGISIDGTGKVDGAKVEFGLMLLETKNGKIVMVLGFAQAGTWKKNEAAVAGIFKSLKPTR